MKSIVVGFALVILAYGNSQAATRTISIVSTPKEVVLGSSVHLECKAAGPWLLPLKSAKITIKNPKGTSLVSAQTMTINGLIAGYDYAVPGTETSGNWSYSCEIKDRRATVKSSSKFIVGKTPGPTFVIGPIPAHNTITTYNGASTCISCHTKEATEMVNSLHTKWKAPTPELTNTKGQELGKAQGGINTFCTYAMSSKNACFSCHVRSDGNAPHPAAAKDVDCLMCHSDTYQRKFITDPASTQTVTNVLGKTQTYVFGKVDSQGNYIIEPDYSKMPAGTNMVNVARTVHLPTSKSCLRCHATAGGGDWTKRGDMGLNSVNPTVDQDVHLSQNGAKLACVDCHSALNHKIGGRGIDLRGTEASAPTCQACHTAAPHADVTLNRHAAGQVSCQVCHIREFAKGGATEMSRDWRTPVWNSTFCSGQGGFVGEETRASNVKPEYVWFDGTSYVYNIDETIKADAQGVYHMAKANGAPFDGKSSIVPIKRHSSVMALHESGKLVPPAIMWMFMTGKFDIAVQKGMQEQGMSGNYTLVKTDAEMLITHGVEPKSKAPKCIECHNNSGDTPDGSGMVPFTALGYHTVPAAVQSCTLCHERKNLGWADLHQKHRSRISCSSCHTKEPTGLIKAKNILCSSCHESESWQTGSHKKHIIEEKIKCSACHTFT